MRHMCLLVIALAACTGSPDGVTAQNETAAAPLFETAVLGAAPYALEPARLADGDNFVGVRFTTTRAHTIVGLGAQVFNSCSGCDTQMVMAVVPLDRVTRLPATTDLHDAVGYGIATVPYADPSQTSDTPPADVVFPASFVLRPGTWGLVLASNVLGVPWREGELPLDNVLVDAPQFFHCFSDGGVGSVCSWADDASTDPMRLFVLAGDD